MSHPYEAKLARILDRMGGAYLLQDILRALDDGKMQSFAVNDSWAVTQIVQFPRAKMMEILAVVGELEDSRKLHDMVLGHAADNDIGLVQAYGRRGWLPDAIEHGWRVKARSFLYQKSL